MALVLCPPAVSAQTPLTVQGRVYESTTGAGIQNAIVTLEGYGATLTAASGSFRFDDVEPGEYSLSVDAFGYVDRTLSLRLETNTTVDVPLEPEPFRLDPLDVDLETLDFDGRAVDPAKDLRLIDAQVLSSQGHEEWTDAHGQFDLDDVYEGVPLQIEVRSFGYLPLDTTFVPDDDERHEFELFVDPAVQRVIDMQVDRIVDITRGRASVRRPLDQEALLRFRGTFTVYDMILYEYGRRADRVGCLVVDERQIPRSWGWRSYLTTMLPEELARLEFLFSGAMLRIYTRDFVRRMPIDRVELRTPTYVEAFGEPFCT